MYVEKRQVSLTLVMPMTSAMQHAVVTNPVVTILLVVPLMQFVQNLAVTVKVRVSTLQMNMKRGSQPMAALIGRTARLMHVHVVTANIEVEVLLYET